MPVRRIEATQLSALLGSLLSSVVDAEAAAARTTVDFIADVGFEDVAESDGGGQRLQMVALRYDKRDENGDTATFEVKVPLLSLVNVPRLSIEEATLSMAYDVVSVATKEQAAPDGTAVAPASVLGRRAVPVLRGLVRSRAPVVGTTGRAPTSPANRSTTSVDLDVTMRIQPMPVGIERLFDLAELGITEAKVEEDDGGGG